MPIGEEHLPKRPEPVRSSMMGDSQTEYMHNIAHNIFIIAQALQEQNSQLNEINISINNKN